MGAPIRGRTDSLSVGHFHIVCSDVIAYIHRLLTFLPDCLFCLLFGKLIDTLGVLLYGHVVAYECHEFFFY